jgi:hypothetical protein
MGAILGGELQVRRIAISHRPRSIMLKHSTSHGCATFVCTILAGVIVYLLHRFLPDVLKAIVPVTAPLSGIFGGIPFFTEENIAVLLLAAAMAILWGVFFKMKMVR